MISSVCQSLQSHVLSFQLFPQEPSYYSSRSSPEVGENSRESVEAVSNGNEEDNNVYVHPLVKSSCTRLSKESLEMCTESLGSESGSDAGENDISLMRMEADDCGPNVRCSTWKHEKGNRKRSYPPPLTSISGVRMESYREDGRLVLRAVACSASCCSSYFHAERSQGRLKLQLVKVKDMAKQKENDEQGEDQEQQGDEVLEEEEEEGNWGTRDNEEIEILERPRSCCICSSSCKQERRQSKDLLNWNPTWVST